ncbi:MAG: LemA family protein [Firmicutes bacterium]|nr:LemA family protein [Bacillota bacterium]
MISLFGIISAVVAVVSIIAMVLHFRLMQKRGAVDEALASINDILYAITEYDDDNEEAPAATSEEIEEAARAYNDAVKIYNEYISRFPGKIIALVVGFKKEEVFCLR